jgi:hypothetical protein
MWFKAGDVDMVRLGLAAGAAFAWSMVSVTGAFGTGKVEPVGKWNTSIGPMTIQKTADGLFSLSFAEFPGTATGELYDLGDGDLRMKGVWRDIIKDKECAEASEGSKHWGGFDMTFHGPPNVDREAVNGIWTLCELIKPKPTAGMQATEGMRFAGEKVR